MNEVVNRFLNKYLGSLKKHFQPQGMWIWGSYAYGQPREDSDIDVLLVSKDFNNYRFIQRSHQVANQLKTWSDKEIPDIDFICYTPEEFERKKGQISLAKEIYEKGIKII